VCSQRLRVAVVTGIALWSLGCPRKTSIWVEPGSTLRRLEFGISSRRGGDRPVDWGGLRVYACSGTDYGPTGAAWAVGPFRQIQRWPVRVQYGVPPEGFQTVQGPEPLRPGCYRALVAGTGLTQFIVREDSSVIEVRVGAASDSTRTTRSD
jgi:hypothetical protein